MDDVSKNTKLVSLSINCDSFTSCQLPAIYFLVDVLIYKMLRDLMKWLCRIDLACGLQFGDLCSSDKRLVINQIMELVSQREQPLTSNFLQGNHSVLGCFVMHLRNLLPAYEYLILWNHARSCCFSTTSQAGLWSRKSHHPTPTPGNFNYPTPTPTPTFSCISYL